MDLAPAVEYSISFAVFMCFVMLAYRLVMKRRSRTLLFVGCLIMALSVLLEGRMDHWDFVQYCFLFPVPAIVGGLMGGFLGWIQPVE